jgi:hypothetical protein
MFSQLVQLSEARDEATLLLDIVKQALSFNIESLHRWTSPCSFSSKLERDQAKVIHLRRRLNSQ